MHYHLHDPWSFGTRLSRALGNFSVMLSGAHERKSRLRSPVATYLILRGGDGVLPMYTLKEFAKDLTSKGGYNWKLTSLIEVFLWTLRDSMHKKMERNGTEARTLDQVVLQEAFTEIRVMLIQVEIAFVHVTQCN